MYVTMSETCPSRENDQDNSDRHIRANRISVKLLKLIQLLPVITNQKKALRIQGSSLVPIKFPRQEYERDYAKGCNRANAWKAS